MVARFDYKKALSLMMGSGFTEPPYETMSSFLPESISYQYVWSGMVLFSFWDLKNLLKPEESRNIFPGNIITTRGGEKIIYTYKTTGLHSGIKISIDIMKKLKSWD